MTDVSLNVVYGLKLVDLDRVLYVGRTSVGIKSRFDGHIYMAKRHPQKSLLYKWMNRVGIDRVECVLLEELPNDASIDQLNLREVFWIDNLQTHYTKGGLNSTLGGQGRMSGYKHSQSTRSAISKALAGKKFSKERRAKLSESHMGLSNGPRNTETKQKISATLTGHSVSEEARIKLSKAHRGRKVSDAHAASNRIASHIRWHVNRGVVKADCIHCESR